MGSSWSASGYKIALLLLAGSLIVFPRPTLADEPGDAESGTTLEQLGNDVRELKDEIRLLRETMEKRMSEAGEARDGARTAMVSIDDDAILGKVGAPVTMIEFSDYQCPFCKDFVRKTFPQIKARYIDTGQVRYVFRDFPLSSIHQQAERAAVAATCAGQQGKYWEMHDKLFDSQPVLKNEPWDALALDLRLDLDALRKCMKSPEPYEEAKKDMEDGRAAGVQGTPGFFVGITRSGKLIEGKFVRGALPFEVFRAEIDNMLARAQESGK